MPSTANSWDDIGWIDPGSSAAQLDAWFRNSVLKTLSADAAAQAAWRAKYAEQLNPLNATSGVGVATGLGSQEITGAPQPHKYYGWLSKEILTKYGKEGETATQVWNRLTPAQKSGLVSEVGTSAIKDENAGSLLGNVLIKPTMPLSLIGPFNAIPGAAAGSAVSTVGITGSGGVGTILGNPALGELGTGIVTAGSAAGGLATGGGSGGATKPPPAQGGAEPAHQTWYERLGYETVQEANADGYRIQDGKLIRTQPAQQEPGPGEGQEPPDVIIPPNTPGVDPGTVGGEGDEQEPPIVAPGSGSGTPTAPNIFDSAIGNMGAFHGQASLGRTPYTPVEAPTEGKLPGIRHSAQVESALRGPGTASPAARGATQPGLGLSSYGFGAEQPTGASTQPSALERLRARRRGLGLG